MNAKYLPVKFAIVAAVIAVCIFTLYFKGLQPGQDIAGGHSLRFKLDVPPGTEGRPNVRAIEVLKERIDPDGLLNIEFLPIGSDQIEVRMPPGSPETIEAKRKYVEAMNALLRSNIAQGDLMQIAGANEQQRQQMIDRLAGGNEKLAGKLREVGQKAAEVQQARTALEDAQKAFDKAAEALRADPDNNALAAKKEQASAAVEAAQGALQQAEVDLYRAQRSVRESNIEEDSLQQMLAAYVPAPQAEEMKKQGQRGKNALAARQEAFSTRVAQLKARAVEQGDPARAEQIQNVVDLYRTWVDNRRSLGDPADMARLILNTGVLEFRIAPRSFEFPMPAVDGRPLERLLDAEQAERYVRLFRELGPQGVGENEPFRWFPVKDETERFSGLITVEDELGNRFVLLANTSPSDSQPRMLLREPGRDKWQLSGATVTADEQGLPAIAFQFDDRGGRLFNRLTTENVQRLMAITLDKKVYSAPVIREAIRDRGTISGSFTPQEANELVRTLNAGTLPARLQGPTSETSFDPILGAANKNRGIFAAWAGLIAVAVFMLVYYLMAGFIADLALVLNILLVLGAMSLMGAVFTLPGIAGIILTIGMAVDANVLIFERLREEQAKGQTVRMALKNAYERAFSAIFDANLTTLVTCVILGWVGTEEVRGFAITLGLGVVFSMFTALVVTRWVFQALLDAGFVKDRIPMLRVIGVPRVNWMAKRRLFWGLSLVLVVLGVGSLIWQGSDVLGVEFVGGTKTLVRLEDDVLIDGKMADAEAVKARLLKAAEDIPQASAKLVPTLVVERREDPGAADRYLTRYDLDRSGDISKAEWPAGVESGKFARVDQDSNGVLTRAELDAMASSVFQLTTTESNREMVRTMLTEGLGAANLVTQQPLNFEIAAGQRSENLKVDLAPEGTTQITAELAATAAPLYRDPLSKFEGGLLMVVTLPTEEAVTADDVQQRIIATREGYRLTEVIGLEEAAGGRGEFTRLAILVSPPDELQPERWGEFARGEEQTIRNALRREGASETQVVGAQLAGERAGYAIAAIVLSWLAIILYLWFRFGSVQWGLAAVICLIHDVIIVVGLVAVSGWLYDTFLGTIFLIDSFKIDLTMVAAILTVIGYSVNDTIVVFDRIRENRGRLAAVSGQVINDSINQTLPRTLLTSFTTFLVVFIMYVWGGPAIHAYNYALLTGIIFGTYSSIAVASPLIMGFKKALVAKVVQEPQPAASGRDAWSSRPRRDPPRRGLFVRPLNGPPRGHGGRDLPGACLHGRCGDAKLPGMRWTCSMAVLAGMLAAGCSTPTPPETTIVQFEGPPPLAVQQLRAYPETVTGRFVSLVDFEDAPDEPPGYRQVEHFRLTGSAGDSQLQFVVHETSTGAGALSADLRPGAVLRCENLPLRDFSRFALLSLAVHTEAPRDDLRIRLISDRGIWTSPRRLLTGGWTNVLVDIQHLREAKDFNVAFIRAIELELTSAGGPVQVGLDDLMLVNNERTLPGTPPGLALRRRGLDLQIESAAWGSFVAAESADGLYRLARLQPAVQLVPPRQALPASTAEAIDPMGEARIGTLELLEVNPLRVRLATPWYFPSRRGEWHSMGVRQIRWEHTLYGDGRWITLIQLNNAGGPEIAAAGLVPPASVWTTDAQTPVERIEAALAAPAAHWTWMMPPREIEVGPGAYATPAALQLAQGQEDAFAAGDRDRDRFDESQGCYWVQASAGRCRFRLLADEMPMVDAMVVLDGIDPKAVVTMEGVVLRDKVPLGERQMLLKIPGRLDRPRWIEAVEAR